MDELPSPLQPQRKLNDPRLVRLRTQILKPGGGVRIHIIRMIEEVEEISREAQFYALGDAEVFEYGDIRVPGARAKKERPCVRIDGVGDGRQSHSAVGERLL